MVGGGGAEGAERVSAHGSVRRFAYEGEDRGGGKNPYMSQGRDNRGKGTTVGSLGKGYQAEVRICILDRIQKI